MHVVLEEIENNIACLVPDLNQDPIYVPVTALPLVYEIGDVFIVKAQKDNAILLEKDSAEKEKRVSNNKLKRERLLRRSSENNRKHEEY